MIIENSYDLYSKIITDKKQERRYFQWEIIAFLVDIYRIRA
ncbi:hypothetical protein HMPREF2531_05013 [Bacteroides intestinalis]|uniref:Uncharacterized protein n=1 Tax=Bacteroides intestinalis TaxID=329854 RepID=A0A139KPU9_9BACE|nr:hypothetical protein HMPREF2531_05013 [Bacteroides intestinalis]